MKVVTLSQPEFERQCRYLRKIVEDKGFRADAVVAIARGGVFVANACGFDENIPVFIMKSQRGTTKAKKGTVTRLVRLLPRVCNDCLRIVEAYVLRTFGKRGGVALKEVAVPNEMRDYLRNGLKRNILVIDDAIDSGCTMASVVESIKGIVKNANIHVAVLTVTMPDPVINADSSIYNGGVIVRFPWSIDY